MTQRSTIPAKRKDTWQRRFSDLKLKLDNGFNIRTREYQTQKYLEKASDVKMTDDDEDFYLDNCQELEHSLKLADGTIREPGQCKCLAKFASVDSDWLKSAVKRRTRTQKELASKKIS